MPVNGKRRYMIPEDRKTEELPIVKKLSRAEILEPYRTQRITKDGRTVNVWLTATSLVNEAGEVYAIATTEREIKLEDNEKKSPK